MRINFQASQTGFYMLLLPFPIPGQYIKKSKVDNKISNDARSVHASGDKVFENHPYTCTHRMTT